MVFFVVWFLFPFFFLSSPEHISVAGESFPILCLFPEHFFLKTSRVERGEYLQRMQNKNTHGFIVSK